MGQTEYNVLRLLRTVGKGATPQEVAGRIGINEKNAGVLLSYYHKRGVLDRTKVSSNGCKGCPPFSYKLTERGEKKLDYMETK